MLDPLELRQLLSNTFANGVLTVTGTEQNDTISITRANNKIVVTLNGSSQQFSGVERINLNARGGNDNVNFSTISIPVVARGWSGNDVIFGGKAGDKLFGDGGTDQLYGNGGDDRLDGGSGSFDLLSGGDGNDVADYSRREEDLSLSIKRGGYDDGAAGENDNIRDDVEAIASGEGDDTITGWKFDDTLFGGDGDDSINGDDGRDVINGDDGDDSIHGNDGSDTIRGGDGDDEIDAGGGDHNFLYGGDGDDLLDSRNDSTDDAVDGGPGHDFAKIDVRLGAFGEFEDADNTRSVRHVNERFI